MADRAALLKCMENRPALEAWRQTLTSTDRLALNHPRAVWRKFSGEEKKRKGGDGKGKVKPGEKAAARMEKIQTKLQMARDHIRRLESILKRHELPPPRPRELDEAEDDFDEDQDDEGEEE